jgi:hypothetical protein
LRNDSGGNEPPSCFKRIAGQAVCLMRYLCITVLYEMVCQSGIYRALHSFGVTLNSVVCTGYFLGAKVLLPLA